MSIEEAIKILNIVSGKEKGVHVYQDVLSRAIEAVLNYIETLKKENETLKRVRSLYQGLNKEKKHCFIEDGYTGKCLGYSFANDDEPCEYCKSCEKISIREED